MIDQKLDGVFGSVLDDGGHHLLEYVMDLLLLDVGFNLLLELHLGLFDVNALSGFIVLLHFEN